MRADDEFSDVYRAEQLALLRLAYLVCGDQRRAEDAVADAVEKTLPRWRRGHVDDLPRYLRRAVVNAIAGGFRRRAVERRALDRRNADERGASGLEEQVADEDVVWRALLTLPPPQRVAIVLRYYEDLSERETAATLGISVGTVKSRVSRGFDHIRELLREVDADA